VSFQSFLRGSYRKAGLELDFAVAGDRKPRKCNRPVPHSCDCGVKVERRACSYRSCPSPRSQAPMSIVSFRRSSSPHGTRERKRMGPGDYDNKSLPFSRFSTSGGPKLSIRASIVIPLVGSVGGLKLFATAAMKQSINLLREAKTMENRCILNRNWTNTFWIIVHKQNRR